MPPDDLKPPPDTAEEIRRRAEEILARAEFRPDPKSLYERIVDFLIEQFDRVIESLLGGGRSALVGWLVVVGALAVLVITAVRFGRGVRSHAHLHEGVDVETRRPAEDWRAEAAAHEANGEWRAALRCRYRALVADLAQRGLVEEIPGRTAGEYRREVAVSVPRASDDFAEVTRRFELAWYGDVPTAEADVGEVRRLSERVTAGV